MAEVTGGDGAIKVLAAVASSLGSATEVRAGFTESAKYPDGTPIATAAAANNFGAPSKGIPPRPFFTTAVNSGKGTWGPVLGAELKRAGMDAHTALSRMGEVMAGDIASALVATTGPALSPVTLLLRKRFPDRVGMTFADVQKARQDVAQGVQSGLSGTGAKPLVWTGAMLRALYGPGAYEVD